MQQGSTLGKKYCNTRAIRSLLVLRREAVEPETDSINIGLHVGSFRGFDDQTQPWSISGSGQDNSRKGIQ